MKTKAKQTAKNRPQSRPGSPPSRKMSENDQNKRTNVPDDKRDENVAREDNLGKEGEPMKKGFDEVQQNEEEY